MKKSYLRTSLALALALGLASCGGDDDGDLQLGVALSGVTKEGLTLKNNGGEAVPVAPGNLFVFPKLVAIDSQYDVTVASEPTNVVAGSCKVNNPKGKIGTISPQNISVVCEVKTYELGGRVETLSSNGLVVNNGSQRQAIPSGAVTFSMTTPATDTVKFPGQVPEGTPYAVTVLTQPTGQICTVQNGTGTMPAAPVDTIVIKCT